MKVILMIGLDTTCQLNCLHNYKEKCLKYINPFLRNALNICFNFNKKHTFQSLKDALSNLKINKTIPVQHSILNFVKLK